MSILRKKVRRRYTSIDNTPIEDNNLTWDCKGLLLYLLSKPDGWVINSQHLATETPDGLTRVRRILNDLERLGYLKRYRERANDGTFFWISEISETPFLLDDAPIINPSKPAKTRERFSTYGSPDVGSPDVGSPDVGSPDVGYSDDGLPLRIVKTEKAKTELIKTELIKTDGSNAHTGAAPIQETFSDSDCLPPKVTSLVTPLPPHEAEIFPRCSTTSDNTSTITLYENTNTDTTTGTKIARLEQRMREVLAPDDLTEICNELIAGYNTFKPATWGQCTGIQPIIKRHVENQIRNYRIDSISLNDAIESFKIDFKGATLACAASKYHAGTSFDGGNITWLLDPKKLDRIPQLAQRWRDLPSRNKIELAQSIVSTATVGVPKWEDAETKLTGIGLIQYKSLIKTRIERGECYPIVPDREYLAKYFPDLGLCK